MKPTEALSTVDWSVRYTRGCLGYRSDPAGGINATLVLECWRWTRAIARCEDSQLFHCNAWRRF